MVRLTDYKSCRRLRVRRLHLRCKTCYLCPQLALQCDLCAPSCASRCSAAKCLAVKCKCWPYTVRLSTQLRQEWQQGAQSKPETCNAQVLPSQQLHIQHAASCWEYTNATVCHHSLGRLPLSRNFFGIGTCTARINSAKPFPSASRILLLVTPLPSGPYTTKCTALISGISTLSR